MLSKISLDDGSLMRDVTLLVVQQAVSGTWAQRELASISRVLVEGQTLLLGGSVCRVKQLWVDLGRRVRIFTAWILASLQDTNSRLEAFEVSHMLMIDAERGQSHSGR